MTGTLFGLLALAGMGIVIFANWLRQKRTDGCGCVGHVFVAASQMSTREWLLNRGGIAVFVVGIIGGFLL